MLLNIYKCLKFLPKSELYKCASLYSLIDWTLPSIIHLIKHVLHEHNSIISIPHGMHPISIQKKIHPQLINFPLLQARSRELTITTTTAPARRARTPPTTCIRTRVGPAQAEQGEAAVAYPEREAAVAVPAARLPAVGGPSTCRPRV